jgi:hypothetical protein
MEGEMVWVEPIELEKREIKITVRNGRHVLLIIERKIFFIKVVPASN